jgi:hypothetical protein
MFVDNKGAIKSCKSKKHRKCNHQKKRKKKEHTTTYKTLHRKQKIEQHQSTSIKYPSEQEHANVLSLTAHVPLLRHGMFEHGVSETK